MRLDPNSVSIRSIARPLSRRIPGQARVFPISYYRQPDNHRFQNQEVSLMATQPPNPAEPEKPDHPGDPKPVQPPQS